MKSKLLIIFFLIIAIIGIIFLVDNQPTNKPIQDTKLTIATSFYPLYFFTSQIAGDRADVFNITPAGAEPHDYEPTTKDIIKIGNSQLLVLNGSKLEAWGDKIKDTLTGTNTKITVVSNDLANQTIKEDGSVTKDAHIWLNPLLAKQEAEIIAQEIIKIDPENTNFYQTNLEALKNNLDNLDNKFKQGLSNCQIKDIITAHAAFGYLASAYALNQVSIAGLSPDEEPSPKKLAEVSDFAKINKIKYIFFESLVSPKLAETIAQETGAKTLILNPLEGISTKDMQNGKNYFTEMENNLANLKIALECK